MGEILSKRRELNKIIYRIEVPIKEGMQLKNHMKKVHLFSLDNCGLKTKLVGRGNNGGAKYFQIPLSLKSRRRKKFSEIAYQRIDLDKKSYYILVASK